MPTPPEPRARRSRDLEGMIRRITLEADRLGHTFAQRHHLHPTDLAALIHVMDAEGSGTPLTPGQLAHELGLSPGATTSVIDRLQAQGHLRREPDAHDRRRTLLHFGEHGFAVGMEFFGPLAARTDAVIAEFSDAELATVQRYLTGIAEAMAAHRASLTSPLPSAADHE